MNAITEMIDAYLKSVNADYRWEGIPGGILSYQLDSFNRYRIYFYPEVYGMEVYRYESHGQSFNFIHSVKHPDISDPEFNPDTWFKFVLLDAHK